MYSNLKSNFRWYGVRERKDSPCSGPEQKVKKINVKVSKDDTKDEKRVQILKVGQF